MNSSGGRSDPQTMSLETYVKQVQNQRKFNTPLKLRKCLKCSYANFLSGTRIICPFSECFKTKEARKK